MNFKQSRNDRYFYFGISVWFILLSFFGFAQSFYIKRDPEIPLNLIIHGALFSCWILLFFVQSTLISTGNIKAHKYMGVLGLILILAMIPVGFYTVLYKVSLGKKGIDEGGYNLFTLTTAYLLVFSGLLYRSKPFYHKRFMLFAIIVLTIAATDRVAYQLGLEESQLFRKSLLLFPSFALFVFDLIKLKRFIWFDLLPILLIGILFFTSDYFWLSATGKKFMEFLVNLI